ncbi:MAG: phytanoyl-CoA dioxygenase family protein [Candidatus Latescibacterota bacterium]|jgi:ectoine hydroxylase-related dioxygenase (phytanoyl-CoA dioxygenase family)
MATTRSSQREQYDRDGYAVYRGVLDADLVHEAGYHVDWLQQQHPDLRPEKLGHTLMSDDPFWVRLVSDDRLLDIAQEYVGPNIALFASHYISKPPGDGQPVLFHQDGSYWPLEPMEVVTLWLAVDDSTAENGCMRVVPGTQHLELQQMQRESERPNVLGSRIDPALVDESRAVDVVLQAGDVSVHHPNVVHGSNANTSLRRRCGLTIRYIPTRTRIVSDGQWPSAFLLRGAAVPGINQYLPRPRYREGKHLRFRGCEAWA